MTDEFILTVDYKGAPADFPAQLFLQGYTHRIRVKIGTTEVYFEPDEGGSYRVIKMPEQEEKELLQIDRELLHAIQQKIEEILA
jgi:hypothetical protein